MFKTVSLPASIKRAPGPNGECMDLSEVTLRQPNSGELRGLETVAILRMDYVSHRTLIPRICPQVTAADLDAMPPKSLLELQSAVVGFFVD